MQTIPATTVPPLKRYADAFHVAKLQVGLGTTLKILAAFLGGGLTVVSALIVLGSLAAINKSPGAIIGLGIGVLGFCLGILIGVLAFLFGVHLSSQGQILRVTLDTAVNSSPFLTDAEKAQAMSLPTAGDEPLVKGIPLKNENQFELVIRQWSL
jgi:hypothetical protein